MMGVPSLASVRPVAVDTGDPRNSRGRVATLLRTARICPDTQCTQHDVIEHGLLRYFTRVHMACVSMA
jgi:hypothetical protein